MNNSTLFRNLATLLLCSNLLVSCSDRTTTNTNSTLPTTINTSAGGTVTAADGTTLTVFPSQNNENVAISLEKSVDNKGSVVNRRLIVTPDYAINVKKASSSNLAAVVTVKVETAMLPTGWDPGRMKLQVFSPATGQWTPLKALTYYAADAGTLSFDLAFPPATPAASAKARSLLPAAAGIGDDIFLKIRVTYNLMSDAVSHPCSQGSFTINYIPPFPASADSVTPDLLWNSTTGNAVDPSVPDFVEDVCAALNTAYVGYRGLKADDGSDLFSAITGGQKTVYLADAGAALGDSPIGGPITIASHGITSWDELRTTVAHELGHLFEGQYFLSGAAGNVRNLLFSTNRWYLEAAANYYAALVLGLNDAQKAWFYQDATGKGYGEYLAVSLTEPSNQNMYSAAHFLDWMVRTLGPGGQAVVDAGMRGSGTVLENIDKALAAYGGIGPIYAQYGLALFTDPDGYAGMNMSLRTAIAQSKQFNTSTYLGISRQMPPLSMAYVRVTTLLPTDSMLVMSSEGTTGGAPVSHAYDFIGTKTADYLTATELGAGSYPWVNPLKIKHFGAGRAKSGAEQLIVNTSRSASVALGGGYYLLQPPVVKTQQPGAILFESNVGTIPAAYIKGYNLYRKKVEWLNENDLVPVPSSGTEQSYLNPGISAGDAISLQVVDKYDNKWPEFGGIYGVVQFGDILMTSGLLNPSYLYSGFADESLNTSCSGGFGSQISAAPGILSGTTLKSIHEKVYYGFSDTELQTMPCRGITYNVQIGRSATKDAITSVSLLNRDVLYGPYFGYPEYPTATHEIWQLTGAGSLPLTASSQLDGSTIQADLAGVRYMRRTYEATGSTACSFVNSASYTWNSFGQLGFLSNVPDQTLNTLQCSGSSLMRVNIYEPL